ncbi:MAG TPA: Rid family detoxifying hydrolase [Acidobacteriota bacterium]|nr:Rid family detoxifying hydrolase [Acidobacteriota bacterium]HRR26231.1 Rid family detoxifying hydrolase [Acidobacteriota bacterium]HRV06931.1 Rid family detoxifying hydrolase [Acidobacteriota bacterium]
MKGKRCIVPAEGPRAGGPYSPAVAAGGWIFVAGQIPVDPRTGEVVRGSIEEQTRRVLENVRLVLRPAGVDLDAVVRTTVYLRDLSDFSAMNGVYAAFFSTEAPARTTVGVADLPQGVDIEIDAIAWSGE